MGKLTLVIVTCVTICLTIVAGQQPPPPPPPPQSAAQQQPPPPPQPAGPPQASQHNRRNIIKPGDLVPEYDPLAPSFQHQPQLYGKAAHLKPQLVASSHLLKPGVQYGAQYAPPKPDLLKTELLLKHELFAKPEFQQLLALKPELLKPEFKHLLLAHMQNFYNQKLALLKPQLQQQLPYQPIPMNKYNQVPPHLSKPGLLEAELLKHKQFASGYPELPKEQLKPDLTHLLTPIQKPQILSPSLPPQFAQAPQPEAPPLNQVPQLFVPIPAVQQPGQPQAQPLPPQQPALLPGFEFLNNLPGFNGLPGLNLPGFGGLPGFNGQPAFQLPQMPAFDTTCLLNGNCSFAPQPAAQFPQQPQPLQPSLQPTLQPLQPTLQPLQPNPAAPLTQEGFVTEEQKRSNLVLNENELSPQAAIGACLAKPREPLQCGTSESDWDEVYEQHITCPLAEPRVWKCHCGFYKVSVGDGSHLAKPGQLQPAGHFAPGQLPPSPPPPAGKIPSTPAPAS